MCVCVCAAIFTAKKIHPHPPNPRAPPPSHRNHILCIPRFLRARLSNGVEMNGTRARACNWRVIRRCNHQAVINIISRESPGRPFSSRSSSLPLSRYRQRPKTRDTGTHTHTHKKSSRSDAHKPAWLRHALDPSGRDTRARLTSPNAVGISISQVPRIGKLLLASAKLSRGAIRTGKKNNTSG